MAVPPTDAVLAIAKRHLSLSPTSPDSSVPELYVEELKRHLTHYPYDDQFVLIPEPGTGYGHVICLERNCKPVQIALYSLYGCTDGGKSVGIGSLVQYELHATSLDHCSARDKRVKKDNLVANGSQRPTKDRRSLGTPRKSFILDALDGKSPSSSSKRLLGDSTPARPVTDAASHTAVKVEPQEPVTPRKRRLEEDIVKSEPIDEMMPFRSVPDKRPKILGSTSSPAKARILSVPNQPAKQSLVKKESSFQLGAIQNQISTIQADLDVKHEETNENGAGPSSLAAPMNAAGMLQPTDPGSNGNPGLPNFSSPSSPLSPLSQRLIKPLGRKRVSMPPLASSSGTVLNGGVLPSQDLPMAGPSDDDERYDEQGNFYGKGRDLFVGPVAKAEDFDQFIAAAGNAEQFDGNESVDKALKKLNLPDLFTPLPGMQITLMPHQAIGVAWMLDKEQGPLKGGVLADEMGLGKTIQMIAVIATNRSKDALRKSTLIVAPMALLDQWAEEISLRCNLGLSCLIYHGSSKPKRMEDLRKYDVVLTTFQTLALEWEWPLEEIEEREKKKRKKKMKGGNDFIVDDSDEDKKPRKRKKWPGPLFQMEWYRVCLDEAQNIRNRKTRASRAVSEIDAKYRWCLTGTPIINSLTDAYGLLRFLCVRPWYDWQEFYKHIGRDEKKDPRPSTIRLQAIFATMLLRRKKDSMLDGKRLIELPPKEVNLRKLQFSEEERDIYNALERQSQAKFNRFLREGTVLKNYTHVLVLLLRLRQACNHPCLVQEGGNALISHDEFDGSYDGNVELARAARVVSPDFVRRMKEKFKQVVLERMAAEKESADATIEGEECPICYDNLDDAVVTCCTHVFCRECITNVLNVPAREDANEPNRYKPNERPCPTCRGPISKEKIFARLAFEPTDEDLNVKEEPAPEDEDVDIIDLTEDVKGKGKAPVGRTLRKRKPKPIQVFDSDEEEGDDDDDDISDFIVGSGEDEEEKDARRALKLKLQSGSRRKSKGKQRAIVISDDEDDDIIIGARPTHVEETKTGEIKTMSRFLPSTKMKHMMDTLLTWAKDHPDEKVLVVSQWTQCLQLVSDYLSEHKFLHVKYQGDMSRHQRDQAVRVFMSKDRATIMLMSLKCGGVGLNLTRANRVISLDLGWSEAIESQAFDRVHRLGQSRSVTVERLVIQDTVEDRVLALQERKKNLADGSLGEGTGKKVGRECFFYLISEMTLMASLRCSGLTVRELANLFGISLDRRGNYY
ncbi:hypothetical protein K474DRAFT_702536 [Panus rudis PR-1116 ss-1]|nr:hypothetical protein K474DRAFT_733327 [Panus rudis PR-1116 ss-1]KAI0070941.1 hypothetical protein K474DRAFT_702536 [Panus rudis PR-1116 ss-1]